LNPIIGGEDAHPEQIVSLKWLPVVNLHYGPILALLPLLADGSPILIRGESASSLYLPLTDWNK
jgi:hypothetical protein